MPVLLLVLDQNLAQQLLRGGEGLPRLQLTPTHKRELSHERLAWTCPSRTSYRVFLQRINDQCVSEDGPAVFGHLGLLFGPGGQGGDTSPKSPKSPTPPMEETYESTWFSKERMTGYGDVLKALSAMASITSCSPGEKRSKHSGINIKANGAKKYFVGFQLM